MRDSYDIGESDAHTCLQAMASQSQSQSQPEPISYNPYDSSDAETYPNSMQVDISDMSSSEEDVSVSASALPLNQNLRSIHLSDSDGQSTDTDLSDDAYPLVRGKIVRTDANRDQSLPPAPSPKPPPEPLDLLLFDLMCDHQLSKSVMRDLSSALNKHAGLPLARMPKDRKTLLNRHLKKDHVVIIRETFLYIGVSYSLNDMYQQNKRKFELGITEIKLSFNFDGLPTSKSTNQEVWPILMSTNVSPYLVHVVGVYYGKEKPTCVSLLRELVDELGPILQSGYVFPDGSHLQVTIDYIVCDLPALALVKFFKNACGYAACAKCTVYGEHYKKRMNFISTFHNADVIRRAQLAQVVRRTLTFEADGEASEPDPDSEPETDLPSTAKKQPNKRKNKKETPSTLPTEPVQLRTDQSFRNKTDAEHHIVHKVDPITGTKTLLQLDSPFLDLNIDMVKTFTIDGMHTVYLGTVRRFLKFLSKVPQDEEDSIPCEVENETGKKKKKKKDRAVITDRTFKNIGSVYLCSGSRFPREFARYPRNFEHLDQWKATELRNFLLYGGDLAIASPELGVPPVIVNSFRCLMLAIRILSDRNIYLACHIPYKKF